MGICIFTMFTLFAVPNLIDKYEDIWEDYQRSLEPVIIPPDDIEWDGGAPEITITEIPIIRYNKADLVVCATLFDKLFDTWIEHVEEMEKSGRGQMEPPTRTGIVMSWEGGQAFRDADCSQFVDNWGYLATHDTWNQIDWDLVSDLDVLTVEEN